MGRRLDRLSAECNQILTIGAVIGREFGIDVLERVCELRGDRLLDVLEEAVAARVITEVPRVPGRYIFSHALIRETLSEELTATRRVRLHRRIGASARRWRSCTAPTRSHTWPSSRITSSKRRKAVTSTAPLRTRCAPAIVPWS